MSTFFPAIVAALLFATFGANAQGFVSYAYQKEGEVVYLESDYNSIFLPKVAIVLEQAGYKRFPTSEVPPGTNSDVHCKVNVFLERAIIGECYTPRWHSLGVLVLRDRLVWTEQEFKGDYSGVPVMIARTRDLHRRASAILGFK